jgi:putative xylitol transport system substrate-binding protein
MNRKAAILLAGTVAAAAIVGGSASAGSWGSSGPSAKPPAYTKTKLRLLGLVKRSEVPAGKTVCFFGDGTTNTYVLANNSGAEQAGKALGVKVTVALGDWDGARQLNQLEDALAKKSCDAISLESIDPNVVCKAATKGATKAGIPVAVGNVPICGSRDWTPGTITYSGSQTLDYYVTYTNWVFSSFMKRYPNGLEIGAITGPANWSGTIPPYGSKVAYAQVGKKFPKIKLKQIISGDFTVEAGLNAANTILQTYPNVKGLIVQYDQNALGAVQALKAKGKKPGEVLIFGLGGDHSGVANVKSGWQTGSFLLQPVEETGHATEAAIAYLAGKRTCAGGVNKLAIAKITPGSARCIPKFLWTLHDPTLKRAFGPKASPFITKANVNVITPEW